MLAAVAPPLTAAERREYTQHFVESGYCIVRGLFSPAEVAQISGGLDGLLLRCDELVGSHAAEISTQLQARAGQWAAARAGDEAEEEKGQEPAGFSQASALRANVRAGSGTNFAVGPPASLTPAARAEAIANPTAATVSAHMASDIGRESALLAEFGRYPRLLTLAADVLDGAALRAAGQQ